MSNQVIVVLDREAAETLTANPMSHAEGCAGPGWDCDCGAADEGRARMKRGRAAIRAALEVDPETRIEHIARAIYGAFLSDHGKSPDTHDSMWRVVCTKKDQYRRQAQAVLSALCENPGQGRGLVDGASPTPVGHEEPGVETGSGKDEN